MTDIVLKRVINDGVGDYDEFITFRPVGDGGVIWDDPRARQITAYVPSDARRFVWIAAKDLAADLSFVIAAYTDGANNFIPPDSAAFGFDYWSIYDIALRSGLTVVSGPDLYTGVIDP